MANRRVGNYTNPVTGETDWLEPETVHLVVLQPRMVTRVGETSQSPINFKLGDNAKDHAITLTAEYTFSGKTYTSTSVQIPEQEFADMFMTQLYADKPIDEAQLIEDAKERAVINMTDKLMENNILIGGMQFGGIGYITVNGTKVMTVDTVEFDYSVTNNQPVRTARIKHCVGNVSLKNLDNPMIELYTGKYKVALVNPVVTEEVEGKIKDYTLTIADIDIRKEDTMPEHQSFANPSYTSDEFIESFIKARMCLLDDLTGRDDEDDDRFNDLF